MREKIKQILKRVYLDEIVIGVWRTGRRIKRSFKRQFGLIDQKIIHNYFREYEIRKLHIGCGPNRLEGWLNTDILPWWSKEILYLDAAKPFPFEDETFDYIFNEHLIEHISYPEGLQMLSECYRVLKKDGVIRTSTPDLAVFIDLYNREKSELQKKYIHWVIERFIESAPYIDDIFVINNIFENFGHQFIYDEKTLISSLKMAGFTKITRCELTKSEHVPLQNLENITRAPEGILEFETFTLEATK